MCERILKIIMILFCFVFLCFLCILWMWGQDPKHRRGSHKGEANAEFSCMFTTYFYEWLIDTSACSTIVITSKDWNNISQKLNIRWHVSQLIFILIALIHKNNNYFQHCQPKSFWVVSKYLLIMNGKSTISPTSNGQMIQIEEHTVPQRDRETLYCIGGRRGSIFLIDWKCAIVWTFLSITVLVLLMTTMSDKCVNAQLRKTLSKHSFWLFPLLTNR